MWRLRAGMRVACGETVLQSARLEKSWTGAHTVVFAVAAAVDTAVAGVVDDALGVAVAVVVTLVSVVVVVVFSSLSSPPPPSPPSSSLPSSPSLSLSSPQSSSPSSSSPAPPPSSPPLPQSSPPSPLVVVVGKAAATPASVSEGPSRTPVVGPDTPPLCGAQPAVGRSTLRWAPPGRPHAPARRGCRQSHDDRTRQCLQAVSTTLMGCGSRYVFDDVESGVFHFGLERMWAQMDTSCQGVGQERQVGRLHLAHITRSLLDTDSMQTVVRDGSLGRVEDDQRRYARECTITFDDFIVELKNVESKGSELLAGESKQGTARSRGYEA